MQIFVLIMMAALIAHDTAAADLGVEPLLGGGGILAAIVGGYGTLAAAIVVGSLAVQRRMTRHPARAGKAVRRLEKMLHASRMVIVALFLAQIYLLGALVWLEQTLGEWILLNEVLSLLPPLSVVALTWWAYYPIDRRMREASLIRRLDSGEPVWPIWTRGQYLLSQVRHQLLLMLVPLLALLGWTQVIDALLVPGHAMEGYRSALTFAGGVGIFITAPLMIRHVWDTVPLAEGELRERLLALCDRYDVRVRQLLLWRTYGGLVNGAVMGLIGPTRYILLTDGLIERLDDEEVEAVMAHELGHVRRHHMPWLAGCALALLLGLGVVLEYALAGLESLPAMEMVVTMPYWRDAADLVLLALMLGGWFVGFGYISRRFERQADTFAVQHLTRRLAEARHETATRVTQPAAEIMSRALLRVSELSQSPPDRPSWRHGSINWRVNYLRGLVGVPLESCSIDAHVRLIRRGCAALGLAAIALSLLAG